MIQNTIDSFTRWYLDVATRVRVEREGATAVEYGLMVALIAAVIIVGAQLLGNNTNATFTDVGETIGGVAPAGG